MDERLPPYHAKGTTLDWSNEEAVVNYLSRMLCSSAHVFDENNARKLTTHDLKRANYLLSMINHTMLTDVDDYEGKMKEINVAA